MAALGSMRVRRLTAVVAAVLLPGVASCAVLGTSGPVPQPEQTSAADVSAEPKPETPTPTFAEPTEPPGQARVVAAGQVPVVPLDGVLLGGVQVQARTAIAMFVPSLTHRDLPKFSDGHSVAVEGLMVAAAGATTAKDVGVAPMVVAAGPHVVGVRYTLTRFPESGQTEAFRTVWTNAATGAVFSDDAFWASEAAAEQFWAEVGRIAATGGATPGAVAKARAATRLRSVEFVPGTGDVVVRFASGGLGHADKKARAVVVAADVAEPLLSEVGLKAREAVIAPKGVVGQVVPPVPQAPAPRAVDCAVKKCVALTFDDGPGPHTPQLLDTLQQKGVPATFFVLGSLALVDSEPVRRMVVDGHEVANHTWSHPLLTRLTLPQAEKQVAETNDALVQVTGSKPVLIRPPYGGRNKKLDQLVPHPVVMWSVDTKDWKHKNPAKVVAEVKRSTRPGSVVLLHDIHKSSVDAVGPMVDYLQAEGYTLVTVSEMFADTGMKNHVVYSSRK